MSDLTDNCRYPSAERIWLYIRLNNVGKYCDIKNLHTDFGRREASSAPYVRYLVKKVKETDFIIDKTKREKPKIVPQRQFTVVLNN